MASRGRFSLQISRSTLYAIQCLQGLESGVDARTIMRIAGQSSIVVSPWFIHPTRRQWSGLSSGCNCAANLPKTSRNDCHPLQYPLRWRERLL